MFLQRLLCAVLSVLAIVACAFAGTTPAGTKFTYQGLLKSGGNAVNEDIDVRCRLFDAVSGPDQVGGEIELLSVDCVDGVFTAEIDFGAAPGIFDGNARWLELDVKLSRQPPSSYQTLAPRQPVTGTPYAIQTRGIYVDPINRVGLGTTAPQRQLDLQTAESIARLFTTDTSHSTFSRVQLKSATALGIFSTLGAVEFVDQSDVVRASMTGVRAGDTSANVSINISQAAQMRVGEGTVQMFGDLVVLNVGTGVEAARIGAPGADGYLQAAGGRLGIGTKTPLWTLDLVSTMSNGARFETSGGNAAIVAYASDTTGGAKGILAETEANQGVGVWGSARATSGNNWGVLGTTSSTAGRAVEGHVFANTGVNYAVYGRTDSASGFDFYAAGAGFNYGSTSSIRWKRTIETIDDPMHMLSQLRGVYFVWDKDHGGQHDIGMIAEEVGAVLPEIVAYEENGIDAIGMDYSKLTPLVVEAVKALRAEKDAEIASLEARIERLEAMVIASEHDDQKGSDQ